MKNANGKSELLSDEDLLSLHSSFSNKPSFPSQRQQPRRVVVQKSVFPSWMSMFMVAAIFVFISYQFSDFYAFVQTHRDQYIEAYKFVESNDYEVCAKWSILSSACRTIRVITLQHYVVSAFKEFIQSKHVYSLISFESYYAQAAAVVALLVFVYLGIAMFIGNSKSGKIADAVISRLQ